MKTPAANFSQDGLARLFSYGQDDKTETSPGNNTEASQANKTETAQGNGTEPPSHTAHKWIAIIAGTISGTVAFAGLVTTGYFMARHWCKERGNPKAPSIHELERFPQSRPTSKVAAIPIHELGCSREIRPTSMVTAIPKEDGIS